MSIDITEKDCIDFTIDYLENYKHMDSYIKALEHSRDNIKAGDNVAIRAITYDDIRTSPTFNISRQVENEVINTVKLVQDIEIAIYQEKSLKKKIDKAIGNLNITRRDVIKSRYEDDMTWTEMAQELFFDEKTLRKYKDEAVRSIAIELFGSKVFREENPTLFDLLAI